MRWLDGIARRFGYVRKGKRASFAAAEVGRLTASLRSETEFINTQLRYELRKLRARSRQAAQNNPFGRRFAQMVVDNVAGPQPFRLQGKVKLRSGKFDKVTNDKLESAWKEWGRPGCDLTGKWSWNTMQRLMTRTLAVDGEILLRKFRGPEYGKHGYAVQLVDVDRLWELKNEALPGGGAIHMGVEVNVQGKPVAYHLLKRKPSQWQNAGYTYDFERVPAEDMLHIFVPESAEQVRGVPWMYAALLNLVHIGAFEEAAVIAARVGAAQMGFIQTPDGTPPSFGDGTDSASGHVQIDAEPGSFPVLPEGTVMQGWNPKYPDAAIEPFLKATLRGVSAGLGVAYHNLSGDMEGVNYSSARVAELDERDAWCSIQGFVCEHLVYPNFEEWLRMSLLTGGLPWGPERIDKLREVHFQGKRWQWVDPQKEVSANLAAIAGKVKSRTAVVAETGGDFEDVVNELQMENEMLSEADMDPSTEEPKKPAEEKPEKPEKPEEE